MSDTAMTKLTRDRFIPFLDTAKDSTFTANTWKRIDCSTIFELKVGEQEEDKNYICYPNAVTEISSNKPELPQEIALYEGNPMYDFLINEFYELPTGSDCEVPFLICFGGTAKKAWRGIATITSKTLNTVDGKLSFTIKVGGDVEKGTYTISDGVPSFVQPTTSNG
jgi:hypothetical protein